MLSYVIDSTVCSATKASRNDNFDLYIMVYYIV